MPEQTLFGGAITCDLPHVLADVARVRQVPDHQECWQDLDASRLLVVEILDYQQSVPDEQAARYFFTDLAEANGATASDLSSFIPQPPQLVTVAGLPNDSRLCFGTGFQRVTLPGYADIAGRTMPSEAKCIRVEVCAIRLPSVQTDLLVTLSSPSDPNAAAPANGAPVAASDAFRQIVSTLQIRNWGLFG